MKKYILSIIILDFILCAPYCEEGLNHCSNCNPMTKLCEICNYPEVYTPDIYGGCSGALKCSLGKNYCNKLNILSR